MPYQLSANTSSPNLQWTRKESGFQSMRTHGYIHGDFLLAHSFVRLVRFYGDLVEFTHRASFHSILLCRCLMHKFCVCACALLYSLKVSQCHKCFGEVDTHLEVLPFVLQHDGPKRVSAERAKEEPARGYTFRLSQCLSTNQLLHSPAAIKSQTWLWIPEWNQTQNSRLRASWWVREVNLARGLWHMFQ